MGKTIIIILFAMSLVLLSNGIDVKVEARRTLLKVDRKLKLLNKPAVKSIKSEDGDIIDCVDIHKQPAFDHPALRNHTIQMRPTSNFASETSSTKNESSQLVLSQTWTRSGSCPKGTIPIRRIQRQDLLRVDCLEHFGRDGPRTSYATNTTNVHRKLADAAPANHSTVYLFIDASAAFRGAKGDINVWSPRVEPEEYTTGQIWIKTSNDDDHFASVEAGWVVHPKLYGDARPRLFARWTLDGYKTTGCFDLTCAGFVQISKNIGLGGVINPVSRKGADVQQLISVTIFYDNSNNWCLYIGDEFIGYWPGTLFRSPDEDGDPITRGLYDYYWGGDVYSKNVRTSPHTTTAMGSGEFADSLFANACFIRNMKINRYLADQPWEDVSDPLEIYSDEPNCYTAHNALSLNPPTFYFGGPGRNAKCP